MNKKRYVVAGVAAVALAVAGTVAVNAQTTGGSGVLNERLAPRFGAVVVEQQDPTYQYRAMPALRYVGWKDANGQSHKRFLRSFQITPDGNIAVVGQKTRIQYHAGGSLTDTRNWKPVTSLDTGGRLLDAKQVEGDYAKLNNTFTARGGELVALDEQARKDGKGRYLWRRSSRDGGVSWRSTKSYVDLAGATVLAGAYGHAFQGVIRLGDGTLVMPFYVTHKLKPMAGPVKGTETYMAAHLLVSRDEGGSWKRAATVFKSDHNNYNESTVARRSDGRLIMVTRYDVIQGDKTYSKLAYRVTNQSVNDAAGLSKATWGSFAPVKVPGADNRDVVRGAGPVMYTMDKGILMLVFGRPRNKITFSYDGGRSWVGAHNFYDNIPTSGCANGVPRGTTPQTYLPCSDLGSSGYMGVAVTSPRTAYVIGDSCQGGWGCDTRYGRYPKGTTDKLWITTVRLA